jgi:hypothetical protein
MKAKDHFCETITNSNPNLRSVGQGALIQSSFGRFSDLTICIVIESVQVMLQERD